MFQILLRISLALCGLSGYKINTVCILQSKLFRKVDRVSYLLLPNNNSSPVRHPSRMSTLPLAVVLGHIPGVFRLQSDNVSTSVFLTFLECQVQRKHVMSHAIGMATSLNDQTRRMCRYVLQLQVLKQNYSERLLCICQTQIIWTLYWMLERNYRPTISWSKFTVNVHALLGTA